MVRKMQGYFVRLNEEQEMDAIEGIIGDKDAAVIRKYESIRTVYAHLSDEAAEELRRMGYRVEVENTFTISGLTAACQSQPSASIQSQPDARPLPSPRTAQRGGTS